MPLQYYLLEVTNRGAETGTTTGWTSNGGFTVRTSDPLPPAGGGTYYFMGGNQPASYARQDLPINNNSANTDIDANTCVAYFEWYQANYSTGADNGSIQLRFMDASDAFISNTNVPQLSASYNWDKRYIRESVPYGTRKIRVEMVSVRAAGTNLDAYYDLLSNVYVIVANTNANVSVSTAYAEAITTNTQPLGVNVSSYYVEALTINTQPLGVNVSTAYAEAFTGLTSANANVYQFYTEIIIGAVIPKVMVAGGT